MTANLHTPAPEQANKRLRARFARSLRESPFAGKLRGGGVEVGRHRGTISRHTVQRRKGLAHMALRLIAYIQTHETGLC